jgi:hypothetical protein
VYKRFIRPTLPQSCSKLFNLFVSAGTNWRGHSTLRTLACSLRERRQFAFGELVNHIYDLISVPKRKKVFPAQHYCESRKTFLRFGRRGQDLARAGAAKHKDVPVRRPGERPPGKMVNLEDGFIIAPIFQVKKRRLTTV